MQGWGSNHYPTAPSMRGYPQHAGHSQQHGTHTQAVPSAAGGYRHMSYPHAPMQDPSVQQKMQYNNQVCTQKCFYIRVLVVYVFEEISLC